MFFVVLLLGGGWHYVAPSILQLWHRITVNLLTHRLLKSTSWIRATWFRASCSLHGCANVCNIRGPYSVLASCFPQPIVRQAHRQTDLQPLLNTVPGLPCTQICNHAIGSWQSVHALAVTYNAHATVIDRTVIHKCWTDNLVPCYQTVGPTLQPQSNS